MDKKNMYTQENIIKETIGKHPIVFKERNKDAKMESSICVPSAVQAYSIGIQYVKDWLLKKFEPDYFKTVFINGRHITNDFMKFNSYKLIKRENPAVAITPNPDLDYDRNMQDVYMGDSDMLIRKFNHQQCFFNDYDNNIFLGLGVREQQIVFSIRFRVETRAQQIDLYRNLEMKCRIGFTHKDFISCDFHIPNAIITNIAKHAGFKLDENDKVIDTIDFVHYLNSHSNMPFTYKLRRVNGNREYFIRPNNVYVHLDTQDKLSYDDGNREGQLDNHFNIEMSMTMRMWVPSYYIYTSSKPIYKVIPTLDEMAGIGLTTFKVFDIPDTDENGWNIYFKDNYELDSVEVDNNMADVPLNDIFTKPDISRCIKDSIAMGISPSRFKDIKIYDFFEDSAYELDWKNMRLKVYNLKDLRLLKFAIYVDTAYVNEYMITVENMNGTRIN